MIAAGVMAAGLGATAAAAKTDLLVYTAVEADELSKFKRAFEKDVPDVNIKWVRDSTGIILAKLQAEKSNPKADIVWGVAATGLVMLANDGYFQGYAPKGLDKLDKAYVDPINNPPLWIGQRAWTGTICFNTIEAKKKNIPMPTSWKDLAKPVYKGHVVISNPNSSGTGFLNYMSWITTWGEAEAWKFMDALHQNIAWYTHSGSKPCKQAAAGEIVAGISQTDRGAKLKNKGAPLEVIAPSEGIGWDIEAFGIVHNTKKLDAAKKFADWSVTKKINVMYNETYPLVAYPGVAKPVKHFPTNVEERIIRTDFAKAAANRMQFLKEWQKRYDAKSLPKK